MRMVLGLYSGWRSSSPVRMESMRKPTSPEVVGALSEQFIAEAGQAIGATSRSTGFEAGTETPQNEALVRIRSWGAIGFPGTA